MLEARVSCFCVLDFYRQVEKGIFQMRILEVSYPSRSVTMYIKAHARKVVSYGQ